MKRILDIAAVLFTAPLWLPLMLLAALAVWLIEGRPIFFTQERAGLNERIFRLWKFRTMKCTPGTDKERLSRFGAWLRASSLDELPELVHILTGKMSLVGPRPLPAMYLPRYTPTQHRRHEVKPGLTGWAQIHGRNVTTWEKRLAQDVWYVDNRSLWLDVKILFRTVGMVLFSRGISAEGNATMPEFKPTPQPARSTP